MVGKFSDYKKIDEMDAWDLDAGCRGIINQSSPKNRKLKTILKRQARARLKERAEKNEHDGMGETGS